MAIIYEYEMRFTLDKIADLIEETIDRRPDTMGGAGWRGRTFGFRDTDITPTERQACLNALPESLRLLYSFKRKVITVEE